jgi:hypothetical protein
MLTVEHSGQQSGQISWAGSEYEINVQVTFGNRKIVITQS